VSEPFNPENEHLPFEDPNVLIPHVSWWTHWRPAILAGLFFALVVGGIVVSRQQSATPATTTTTTSSSIPVDCVTCYSITRTLKSGSKGEDVRRLQQRLKDLHFDPGRIDGIYGGDTMMAVWAFQGLVMKVPRDIIVDFVTPILWESMRGEVVITPRRQPGTPRHVEVYLPEQVMVVFEGTKVLLATHVSTGTGEQWCEEVTISPGEDGNENGKEPIKTGVCGVAKTPGGIYYFYMRKLGTRESKLGTMWNPIYFNFGIAVHGAMEVPKFPASHGCVRIPQFISNYFPALVKYNDRVYVFDGVKEPEEYGSQPPEWDKPDPNYTTTTSTTTTTVPKTTVPKTTVPKTTVPTTTTVVAN
jgi:hypothetical protein